MNTTAHHIKIMNTKISNINNKTIERTKSATTSKKKKKSYELLFHVLGKKKSMTMCEMESKLQEIKLRLLESMNKDELLLLTREMLYLKYAIGLMRKHNLSNLYELSRHGLDYDLAFLFPMGRMYPDGVAVMLETTYTCKDNTQLIKDFIAELSPYLNDAEQMLFKFAICEENFNPENDEDTM
jgi:hypothetical protein